MSSNHITILSFSLSVDSYTLVNIQDERVESRHTFHTQTKRRNVILYNLAVKAKGPLKLNQYS